MEASRVCPYCGREIESDEVLFWTTSSKQYDDPIRSDFLRDHGVAAGDKFDRVYFKPCFEGEHKNVVKVDCNDYYPTMLEDVRSNGQSPKQLAGIEDTRDDGNDDAAYDDEYEQRLGNKKKTTEAKYRIVQRACPHCHCELPKGFGVLPVHHVAMFGIRAAGKTAYLVNLFQQANMQLSNNNLGSVIVAEDSKLFLKPLIDEYENSGTTKATVVEGGLLPIVCQYKNGGKESFIVFYDIAGEGTDESDYTANHKGIQNCEVLLMIIDPNMLTAGAYDDTWKEMHGGNDEKRKDIPSIDAFLAVAGENCVNFADNLKSIVCVITKMDMVLERDSDLFGGANSKLEITTDVGKKHLNHVNLRVLADVRSNLDTFLKKYDVDLSEKIHNTFGQDRQVYLLGVSTSTRMPSAPGNTKICFEPKNFANNPKHRIIEPFLVIAMIFGLVSGVDDKGNVKWFTGNMKLPERKETAAAPQQEKKTPAAAPAKKRGFFSILFGGRK